MIFHFIDNDIRVFGENSIIEVIDHTNGNYFIDRSGNKLEAGEYELLLPKYGIKNVGYIRSIYSDLMQGDSSCPTRVNCLAR